MDFIANYWVILLIAFILFLLVLLSYFIDKEIKKMKDTDIDDENIDSKSKKEEEIYIDNENKEEENKPIYNNIDEEMTCDTSDVLDYDELDIEDIEEDFNKVIHKKKLIKDDLKDSIEKMQIDSLNIKKEEETKKIELPEIKIKKETNEDIWKK